MSQRKNKRLRRRIGKKEMSKNNDTTFYQIDTSKAKFIPKGMTRAFKNNKYMVMVYDDCETSKGKATRAMVQRLDAKVTQNHWNEMQRIKNALFGPEVTAVEYYPAMSQLIDEHNIYWLWIFPAGVLPLPIL